MFSVQFQASPWLRTKPWAMPSDVAARHPASTRTISPSSGATLAIAVLGQITAHLGLGMHARRDFAEQLEHRLLAEDHRAVRLFGRRAPDRGIRLRARDSPVARVA